MDFSENPQEGKSTVFYARFREENVYEEFKKLFNDIAEGTHTINTDVAETTSSVITSKSPSHTPTATVPSLPYIGDSHNPSVDADEDEEEEYDEDYGEEENYDEESEVLLESDCKVTLGEAYKSPLSKNVCFCCT
uniref:Uncharacterized protein n=1 Tax=Panagrolaimus superbus TaxID=310955 RepID=A0A914Y8Y6_9BILA